MPTYEYRCKACGREFEVVQKMDDPDLTKCDTCGKDELQRLISWTSVGSDTWRSALKADNPKEAFKGIHAVDRSRNRTRFTGNPEPAAEADPADAPAPAPAEPKKDDA